MTNNLPKVKEKYPVSLVYDEAQNILHKLQGLPVNLDDNDLKIIYGITDDELASARNDRDFVVATRAAMQDLKDSGDSIRKKMASMFSFYLDVTLKEIMEDDKTPPKDKLTAIAMLGKGSGLLDESNAKSKEAQAASQQSNAPVFNLILTQAPTEQQPKLIIDQENPNGN